MWWRLILGSIGLILGVLYLYTWWTDRRAEALYPPSGQFVTVGDARLHYRSQGTGQPVVFLHGGILTADDYDQAMALAAAQGYQALAFDRPGYGYSDRPAGSASPTAQARLLHEALRQLGIQRPILVGHSMSGAMVLAYTLEYPDEVAGVVLLGGAFYGGEAYPAGEGDGLSHLVTTPVLGPLFLRTALVPLGKVVLKSMVQQTFAPDPVPAGYAERAEALWLRPTQFKANREDILAFSPDARTLSPRYGQIRVPTVIVVGDGDPFNPLQQSHHLHEEIPGSQLLVVPDLAHMIPQVRPDVVVNALQKLSNTAGGR